MNDDEKCTVLPNVPPPMTFPTTVNEIKCNMLCHNPVVSPQASREIKSSAALLVAKHSVLLAELAASCTFSHLKCVLYVLSSALRVLANEELLAKFASSERGASWLDFTALKLAHRLLQIFSLSIGFTGILESQVRIFKQKSATPVVSGAVLTHMMFNM